MSWFDEQLRVRKKHDDQALSEAVESIAGAVMGRKLSEVLDRQTIQRSAIEEILKYYHCKIRDNGSENSDQWQNKEIPLDEILEAQTHPYGLMRRTVELESGWYQNCVGALIGTLKDSGSVVALIPGKVAGYSYYDYEAKKRVRLNRKTEKLLETEAVCFYMPLPLKALKVTDLLLFMLQQLSVSDIVMYVGLMGISSAVGLLSPVFNKILFGPMIESGTVKTLLALASFMISFSICRLLISSFQSMINGRVGIKQNIAVQAAVMNRIMTLPASFFKKYASGELAQRSSYVQALCSTLFSTIGTTGLTSLFSLIYIGQVFAYAPALLVPSLLITLSTVILSTITTFAQMKITRKSMDLSSKTSGMTYSMISGVQKIKLAGAEKRMFARWARNYSEEADLRYNPPAFLKLSGTFSLGISLIGTLVLYFLAIESGVNVSDYYAFNTAYGMVAGTFSSVASIAITIANIRPTLEMAKPIMETEPEISEGKEIVKDLKGAIELSHVSFRYEETMPNVIDDLSLKINSGEYLAIVGSTGCGKSTLVRLLLGFEKPQKGSIYFDRKDASRLDMHSLRRKIGVVMQDGKLFLGDLFSNITIAAPHLTLNDAWEAARMASIDEDIRKMPMGMNTIISEGQGGISGGQKQRLMIARAVANKPRIIILDEATSALDNLTQKKVSEAIDGLNCTRIVIAHRLSTIRHCDRIIVLDHGNIVEDGTYDQLIEINGFFADLVRRQRLDVEE